MLQYNIYQKDSISGEYILLANIPNAADSTYIHDNILNIVGCYVITSLDSVGNESVHSDSVCVDSPNGACEGNKGCVYNVNDAADADCFKYRLPNVFTPDNDAVNDFFRPFPYRFIETIHIEIFNRWGTLVYETTDPDILWDGNNFDSKQACTEGTYYYVCTVNEQCLLGITPRVIKGFITLLGNKK